MKNKKQKLGFILAPVQNDRAGFTLIEILVVIGLIAILAAIVIIAINPARQFAQARNSERTSNVEAILNAVGQNIADNKGVFTCASGPLPAAATDIEKTSGFDIRRCIVPTYMPEIPVDPNGGTNTCADTNPGDCLAGGSYDTHYTVSQNSIGRVIICAPNAISEHEISNPGPTICETR